MTLVALDTIIVLAYLLTATHGYTRGYTTHNGVTVLINFGDDAEVLEMYYSWLI